MSKIDVLIIVHNEQEGLLSVGNSERAQVIGQPVNPTSQGPLQLFAERETRGPQGT